MRNEQFYQEWETAVDSGDHRLRRQGLFHQEGNKYWDYEQTCREMPWEVASHPHPPPLLEKLRKKLNIERKLLKCQEARRVHLESFSFFFTREEKKNTHTQKVKVVGWEWDWELEDNGKCLD